MKNIHDAINQVVREALQEAHSSDHLVDEVASPLVHALVTELEDPESVIASNAFEMMMGSYPDESRLSQVQDTDVESLSELVVQRIIQDPDFRNALHTIAMDMLSSAAGAVQD